MRKSLILFEKTNLHNRYFEWFTQNIKKQDIEEIYKNTKIDYSELELNTSDNELKL